MRRLIGDTAHVSMKQRLSLSTLRLAWSRWRSVGLARRIYLAFLMAAVLPMAVAGIIGVTMSLTTLRAQTLVHLQTEVAARAAGVQLFFDQVAAELRFLTDMSSVGALFDAIATGNGARVAERSTAIERDFTRLAELHPHVYQLRVLDAAGRERVRVDKRGSQLEVVPLARLQNKSDRYYVQEALTRQRGELYVSPLDLNEEFGRVEQPERAVIRVAAVVAGADGRTRGLVVVNLHAQVLLDPLQQMVRDRDGVAYLFDRAGHYLFRSSADQPASAMQSVKSLADQFDATVMKALLGAQAGTIATSDSIIAHVPLEFGAAYGGSDRARWSMALAFPERVLWRSVFNLYLLYAVLLAALIVTAVGGYTLSRRLLGPLEDFKREAEVIAEGDFSRRVRVTGHDEIAELGLRFNTMADRLASLYHDLEVHRARLETDVAARARELVDERALLASVFRHAGDAILAVASDGSVTLANTSAQTLFNLPGQTLASHLEDAWPQWRQLVPEVTPGATLRREMQFGAQTLAVSVDAAPDDCQAHAHIVVARDVSEDRRIQDERRQLDRQMFQIEKMATMGELAMGIAHEIGNPLAGMKAVVQALQYEEDLAPPLHEPLRRLESEIDRLSGFLRSFQGIAAPSALDLQPARLQDAMDDILFWTRKEAKSQGVDVVLALPRDLPSLRADPPRLKQVLLNLVVNALHAMPDGGLLTIRAEGLADGVHIVIEDSGSGIAADVLPRIFDPFFTTRSGGSGLGLAITDKIVREHDARIEVDSRPGHGARFLLVWPMA